MLSFATAPSPSGPPAALLCGFRSPCTSFTLIPFIMGLNGWIGGLGIIWLMGLAG